MKTIKIIFNLIDWEKVLYLTLIIFLAKYCFLYGFGYETLFLFIDVCLFAVTCSFFYNATFLLIFFFKNYYNKLKPHLKKIKFTAISFIIIGLTSGIYLSFKIDKSYFSLLFISCSISVIIYAKCLEKKSFIDGLIKSFLTPFTILCFWWLDTPINLTSEEWTIFFKLQFITIIYLILAFLSTLSEEIIRSICTINKDNTLKNKTLPILFGRKRAKIVALFLMGISSFLILFLALYFKATTYIFVTILITNLLPRLIIVYRTLKANTNYKFKQILKVIKPLRAVGILGVISITYYFKYVA